MILRPEDLIPRTHSDNDKDLPECFKCDGKKVNKKGLPCKKCNATGKLNNQFFRELNQILQSEVNKYCTQEYQRMMIQHLANKRDEQSQVIHHGIVCDGCDVGPIRGIRYQCTVRPNFDLCEGCEDRMGSTNQYCFLKIRKPQYNPVNIKCDYQSQQRGQIRPITAPTRESMRNPTSGGQTLQQLVNQQAQNAVQQQRQTEPISM